MNDVLQIAVRLQLREIHLCRANLDVSKLLQYPLSKFAIDIPVSGQEQKHPTEQSSNCVSPGYEHVQELVMQLDWTSCLLE